MFEVGWPEALHCLCVGTRGEGEPSAARTVERGFGMHEGHEYCPWGMKAEAAGDQPGLEDPGLQSPHGFEPRSPGPPGQKPLLSQDLGHPPVRQSPR